VAGTRDGLTTEAEFSSAYQEIVEAWPVPVESREVITDYGPTHLLVSGAPSAPMAVLLPGGGATATAWSGVAGALSHCLRTVAVDPIGQPGLSRADGKPLKRVEDLTDWLDQVLGALTADPVTLVGHSYGAWMALRYCLHAAERLSRLVLVDPTDCFSGLSLRYRVRAVPLIVRPSGRHLRRLLSWETGGRPLDPAWLRVVSLGADLGRSSIVMPRTPSPDELASLTVPTLVAVAAHSRAHDPEAVACRARERVPAVSVIELATATHHSLPTEHGQELAEAVTGFIAGNDGERP
jgi:pimeloyl-ACP methyl ester carboxylesterase